MNDLRQKLLAAFRDESAEHLERIRALISGSTPLAGAGLDEAFRRAHSLKGAARAVDLRGVETLAHRLETLFSRIRDGAPGLGDPGPIGRALDAIEDEIAAQHAGQPPPDAGDALRELERLLGSEESETPSGAPAPSRDAPPPPETVPDETTLRVSIHSVDRLLQSAGLLLTESLGQAQITRDLDGLAGDLDRLVRQWRDVHRALSDTLERLPDASEKNRLVQALSPLETRLRELTGRARTARTRQKQGAWAFRNLAERLRDDVLTARLVPARDILTGFRKMVRDLARDRGKQVEFEFSGAEVEADRHILQALKDPVTHLLRNAVDHGIEPPAGRGGKPPAGRITLHVGARDNRLEIRISDDGRGIHTGKVAETAIRRGLISRAEAEAASFPNLAGLLFHPGFTTAEAVTELSGRGMGLSIVHEAVVRLQGQIEVLPGATGGTEFIIRVPLYVATHRLLLVSCGKQRFGLPTYGIRRLHRVRMANIQTVEGKPVVRLENKPLALHSLAHLLGADAPEIRTPGQTLSVLLLHSGNREIAVAVDAFLAVHDGLIQDVETPAVKHRSVAGGVLLEDGAVCLVLNPAELIETAVGIAAPPALQTGAPEPEPRPPEILVVDDSITTRTLEKSILEAHGYRVRLAVNGREALDALRAEPPDLVVADVQMPLMDGFGLLGEIKKDPNLAGIPVILVTSLDNPEDRERGLHLGADAYILKQKFDQKDLLDTIGQLL